MRKRYIQKKNYKKLSRFDRSLIMGLIINLLNNNEKIDRQSINNYIKKDSDYLDLVKNLGFLDSEKLKKQYESLIDNNLGKLIKKGIVKINKDKKYTLTTHGQEMRVKYNKDWYLMTR